MSGDAPWTSENPFLSGNFAPVIDEIDVSDLPVRGKIPDDLFGVYMRNGPNPQFKPLSYTYPFDGDGMIHALYFEGGQARYRNRFVMTQGLKTERRLGRSVYGGIQAPIPIDPNLLEAGDEPGPFKNGAFVHIIRHAGTYLALLESAPAYEMTGELVTRGLWCPDGPQPIEVNAHTRLDPLTGELFMLTYDLEKPLVQIYRFDSRGKLQERRFIEKSHSTMIHDFLLTKNFIIIFDGPVVFDMAAMSSGKNLLQWRPELGTKIALISRHQAQAQIKWHTTGPCFVFHFANAYEKNSKIVIEYARHGALDLGEEVEGAHPPVLFQSTVNIETGEMAHQALDDLVVEFPRIREDLNSLPHRYVYIPAYVGQPQPDDRFRMLMKYDTQTGKSWSHDFGAQYEIGEAVFAPHPHSTDEDAGLVMLFVYDKSKQVSKFILLNAQDFLGEPAAVISMPRRVPHGLHGSWLPGPW